jgi:phage-related protein
MRFYTTRDLRTIPKIIWDSLRTSGEVVITNNGKPTALMLNISDDNFDEVSKAVRQAKAMIAFNSMRAKAAASGFLTDDEIDAEIASYRCEKSQA